ncbi:hybrid sensor histidine kinase/response regulator, partial [Thioalkalivibrio halophilus]
PEPEPEPVDAASHPAEDEIDPEFGEVFIEEAHDILEQAFHTLAAWREAGGRPGPDQEAFQREVHTLKGSARMAGFTVVGAIAHALETTLGIETEAGQDPRPSFFDAAEKALVEVQGLVERGVGPWQTDENESRELAVLRHWTLEEEAEGDGAEETGEETAEAEPSEAPAGGEAATRAADAETGSRKLQDQVRMDAEVLDSLVNNAGELATFHRRFEQTVGRVENQIEELDRTITRVREQLRKLEIETEAQVLFRVEQETGEEQVDFDPLEMDRYSGIQQLSRALAESVSDLDSLKQEVDDELRTAGGVLVQEKRVGTELQDQLMRQRMVRFARMAPRLRRVVRAAADDMQREVRVDFVGQDSELDRALLERLVAPLEHLLRNAVAHGIETPDEREERGKPREGHITVSLEQAGSEIRMEVADDGGGIDAEVVRAKAIDRGVITPEAELSDNQALQLILQSGFSTAASVNHVAGRGVGMDVVNAEVKQLGGTLDIDSIPGSGSRFTLRLPFTLAISQSLLVQVGEETFAVPMASVEGVVRARREEIDDSGAAPTYSYVGQEYALHSLGEILCIETQAGVHPLPEEPFPLLLVRADEQKVALRVDGLAGSQEVVVKSVGPVLSRIPGVAGATLQGDGSVMLILDLSMLMRFATVATAAEAEAVEPESAATRIMVVDDSITIRKVTARLLTRRGYEVVTARDGLDAVTLLDERRPHLILLDVEMPRMDGFEFAAHVREHPEFHAVPIIMITSRSGSKHRERAMRLGVNGYLGKPYLENDLLSEIEHQLEGTPA